MEYMKLLNGFIIFLKKTKYILGTHSDFVEGMKLWGPFEEREYRIINVTLFMKVAIA